MVHEREDAPNDVMETEYKFITRNERTQRSSMYSACCGRCLALNIDTSAIMDAPEILVHCERCGRFHCKMRITTRRGNILDVGRRSCVVLEIVSCST
jgi:hypothetical protein